jgi:hypothetical protein
VTNLRLNPDQLVECLRRGLNVGIPPTALANMFEMDPETVKNLSMNVRREKYGTAELSELLSDLTFQALYHQARTIAYGSPELAQKAAGVVLSKALATSVRQTPEEVMRAREELLALARQDRLIELEEVYEGEIVETPSSFVAVDEPAYDQGQRRQAEETGS